MAIVVITPEPLYRWDGHHVRLLLEAGFEVVYPSLAPLTDEGQTIEALRGAAAVLAGSEPYTERVLTSLPELRIISRCGVGCDSIDLEVTSRLGVGVAITLRGNFEAVAEHTLAMILALSRSIVRNDRDARAGRWLKIPLVPLRGKTVGIVGLGRIGRSVARRLVPFGVTLLGCDPRPDPDAVREYGIELTTLDALLARSDFVTLHAALTPKTRAMIDAATLARMKPGAYLINTARGGLIEEAALVEALRSGHLAGAALDVLVDEPPQPDNPLLALDNVLLSPHVAANDTRAVRDMAEEAARNIIHLFRGDGPTDMLVTPDW
jgi:phosphoglycerate dehydrogenase-like enzyme